MSVPASMVLTIHDESTGAPATTARLLTLRTAKLTARELIRERVIHEVRRHNDYPAELFILSDDELISNGVLDPARQVARASESFHKTRFARPANSPKRKRGDGADRPRADAWG